MQWKQREGGRERERDEEGSTSTRQLGQTTDPFAGLSITDAIREYRHVCTTRIIPETNCTVPS